MTDIKRVCVFASSCNYLEQSYYKAAEQFGDLLGKSGFDMVYGGSSLGLMWACASKVKENGAQIIGVMPEKLHNLGVNTDECVELFVTPCMRSRKAKMDEISDAVVALPGGFGTLELGYNNKPIVILNINGFYDKLIAFFEQMIEMKFASSSARELFFVTQNPCDAIEYLKNYKQKDVKVTKEQIYNR